MIDGVCCALGRLCFDFVNSVGVLRHCFVIGELICFTFAVVG